MMIEIRRIDEPATKSRLCAELAAQLPKWFGRTESNKKYAVGIIERDALVGLLDGEPRGLIAFDHHFASTCNVWWLAVHPAAHRMGLGRALLERVAQHARERGCRFLTVETMSPRAVSPEFEITRRFYKAVGFIPLVETEKATGDWMMWMLRVL